MGLAGHLHLPSPSHPVFRNATEALGPLGYVGSSDACLCPNYGPPSAMHASPPPAPTRGEGPLPVIATLHTPGPTGSLPPAGTLPSPTGGAYTRLSCPTWWQSAQPSSSGGCLPQPRRAVCATRAGAHQGQTSREGKRTYGGRPGQRVEEQGTCVSHTQKHSEAGYGRPVDRGGTVV